MENITLEKASNPFDGFKVDWQQIRFVSDIEKFTKEIGDSLLKMCLENKHKLIVFLGDILSFLEGEEGYFKGLHLAQVAPELFSDKKIEYDEAVRLVGKRLSTYLQSKYDLKFQDFANFIKECNKRNIRIIYYSGNHDTIIANSSLCLVPLFNNFSQFGNFYVPRDLELIKLNKDLFILGVHTESAKCTEYKQLRDFTNSLLTIENTDKIIFVSHMPGTEKFREDEDCGSKDITAFKQRFRFKYHYHGHCRDYYGEYLEENVPTRSVHI